MAQLVAVSGATGRVGRVVVETLLARGVRVRALGRSLERLEPFSARGAEVRAVEASDARSMAEALRGADAAFVMVPVNYGVGDLRAYHRTVAEAAAVGIQVSRIRQAVNLSSLGADHAHGAGPVSALHDVEQRLNQVPGINLVHLRSAFQMENLLGTVPGIRQSGVMASGWAPDVPLPMVATRDVGIAAAGVLAGPPLEGQSVRELVGPAVHSYREAAAIIGRVVGRPDLAYVQLPAEQVREYLLATGCSPASADALLEMMHAGAEGKLEPRGARMAAVGGITLEQFATEVIKPALGGA